MYRNYDSLEEVYLAFCSDSILWLIAMALAVFWESLGNRFPTFGPKLHLHSRLSVHPKELLIVSLNFSYINKERETSENVYLLFKGIVNSSLILLNVFYYHIQKYWPGLFVSFLKLCSLFGYKNTYVLYLLLYLIYEDVVFWLKKMKKYTDMEVEKTEVV